MWYADRSTLPPLTTQRAEGRAGEGKGYRSCEFMTRRGNASKNTISILESKSKRDYNRTYCCDVLKAQLICYCEVWQLSQVYVDERIRTWFKRPPINQRMPSR